MMGINFDKISFIVYVLLGLGSIDYIDAQSNIDINHYTKDYGKSFRWVYDITQDDKGFIWMANHTGLRRYDGKNYLTYQHSKTDSTSLSTNILRRITKDNKGNLWVYGEDGIVNRLNLETGTIRRTKPRFKEQGFDIGLKDFGVLSNGDFIILYRMQDTYSLWKYNTSNNSFDKLLDFKAQDTNIDFFTENNDGKLWLWGMEKGYYRVDLSINSIDYYPIENKLSNPNVPVDMQRAFWYPNNRGTDKDNDLTSFKLPNEINIEQIDRISVDNLGNIWFYHGVADLYRYDIDSNSLEKFVDRFFSKDKSAQLMYHIFEDKDGGYWNGHFFGAIRFNKKIQRFNTYLSRKNSRELVNSFSGRDIVELSPNKLLVKEEKNDLYSIDLELQKANKLNWSNKTESANEASKFFYSMALSKDGYLWTNKADKLYKTSIETGNIKSFDIPKSDLAEGFDQDELKRYWPRLFIDANNNLWWCDPEYLGVFNESTKSIAKIELSPSPSSVRADFKFAQYDPNNNAIYGSYNQGIYLVDCKTKKAHLIEVFSIQEGYDLLITAVLNWKEEFWITTNKGLIRFDPNTKERSIYSRKDGLPSSIIYGILASNDHLWLATNNGLCQFNPFNKQVINYHEDDGLPFNDFNTWSSIKTTNGLLVFGGQNGMISFNPADFNMQNDKRGELILTEASSYNKNKNAYTYINNLPYSETISINVPANERTLSLKYVHPLYNNSSKNQYFHFMEGLETDWLNDGNKNEVRYTELPPGNYTFRAKAIGANNTLALNEIAIPIIVEQYWYLRGWAFLFYFLIIASIIYMVHKRLLLIKLAKEEAIRIKELDEVKTKMYTNITHEFRTPLTVMLGMNDAVKDYTIDGEIDKIYQANEMIDRNGKNLLNLINQMLELSKLESGLMTIHKRQANIINYLKYRLESFQSYGEAKNINIHFQAEEESIMMDFDVDKISYIVGNLVSNAIKFTPKNGKVYLDVSRIQNTDGEHQLKISVKDTGIGIEADKLDLIFDRFYQVDTSNIRKGEGSGIGLSLVKELVKLLDGTIQVKSTLKEGTEFIVLLPITTNEELASDTPSLLASQEWSESIFDISQLNDKNQQQENPDHPLVLIVEDNADVSHYIAASIKDHYRTCIAKNGNKGLDKALELIPDIIISDIMMPERDGFELCEAIKKDERTSHIPVILLTGRADVESRIQGLEHGADIYLSKPFNRKELLIRLKNLMALRAEIQKHFSGSDFSEPISGLSRTENDFLLKLRSMVLDHIDNDEFGITQLCELMHLSRSQLHRKLTALTGESTSSFIRKIQMEKAKELLLTADYNVSEVAYMVGFKTQAHFSRIFSESYGEPPSNFLKK